MIHRREAASFRRVVLSAGVAAALASFNASAETGSGAASDVTIHVNVLGLAELNVDPQAAVSFQDAAEATSVQDSVPSIDLGNAVIHLSTGVSGAAAEFAPGPTWSATVAGTSLVDFDLAAVDALGGSLLSIGADLIESRSAIAGYCLAERSAGHRSAALDDISFFNGFDPGNLYAGFPGDDNGGNVVLENPGISILGIPVSGLPSLPPPNTSIDLAAQGILGATLILNEQSITGDGTDWSRMTSNAIHLTLDVAGLVTADVTVGHTDAKLDCTQ
jgi:hypothetical protein